MASRLVCSAKGPPVPKRLSFLPFSRKLFHNLFSSNNHAGSAVMTRLSHCLGFIHLRCCALSFFFPLRPGTFPSPILFFSPHIFRAHRRILLGYPETFQRSVNFPSKLSISVPNSARLRLPPGPGADILHLRK